MDKVEAVWVVKVGQEWRGCGGGERREARRTMGG